MVPYDPSSLLRLGLREVRVGELSYDGGASPPSYSFTGELMTATEGGADNAVVLSEVLDTKRSYALEGGEPPSRWNDVTFENHVGFDGPFSLLAARVSVLREITLSGASPYAGSVYEYAPISPLTWMSAFCQAEGSAKVVPFRIPMRDMTRARYPGQDLPFGRLPEPLICQGPFPNLRFYLTEGDYLAEVIAAGNTTDTHKVMVVTDLWFSGRPHPSVISQTFGLDEIGVVA